MRCLYCDQKAGFLRKICPTCAKVIAVVERTEGKVGLAQMVDLFAAEGLTREQVDLVLDAEVEGQPTIRDRLTSYMANALMQGLGMPGRQTPVDVQRIRNTSAAGEGEGTWTGADPERPNR